VDLFVLSEAVMEVRQAVEQSYNSFMSVGTPEMRETFTDMLTLPVATVIPDEKEQDARLAVYTRFLMSLSDLVEDPAAKGNWIEIEI
jgi:hypothetical protein